MATRSCGETIGRLAAAAVIAAAGAGAAQTRPVVIDGTLRKAPFTISKETTVVTEPLRNDGGVDYVGAVNRMQGTGVKPEENGFVVWAGLLGEQQLGPQAEGIARMAGRGMPAQSEAWTPMLAFARGDGLSEADAAAAYDELSACAAKVWRADDAPMPARFLRASKDHLARLDEAMRRPKWWVPKVSTDGRMLHVPLVGLSIAREIAMSLAARATLRGGAGDFDGFLADLQTMRRLAQRMKGEFVIGTLVGCSIEVMADRAIGAVAGRGDLTAEQYAALAQALDALPRADTLAQGVDVFERWSVLDYVQMLAAGETDELAAVAGSDGAMVRSIDGKSVDWDVVLRGMNASVDESLRIVTTQDATTRAALVDARNKRREAAWPAEVRDLPVTLMLMKKAKETREVYSARVLAGVERLFSSNLERAGEVQQRAWLAEDLARVMAAAGVFKAREGRWPATVGELVPRDLKAAPLDLAGKPVTIAAGREGLIATGNGGRMVVSIGAGAK